MTALGNIKAAFRGALGSFDLDVRFDVPGSGITALFGPSGCGKTSILRAMAGLTRLDGALTVNGVTWQDGQNFTPPHKRQVG